MKKLAKEQIIKMAEDEFGARFATNPIYRGLRRALTDFKTIQMSGQQLAAQFITKQAVLKATGSAINKSEVKEELSYGIFIYMFQNRHRITRQNMRNKVEAIPSKKGRDFIYKLIDKLQTI